MRSYTNNKYLLPDICFTVIIYSGPAALAEVCTLLSVVLVTTTVRVILGWTFYYDHNVARYSACIVACIRASDSIIFV